MTSPPRWLSFLLAISSSPFLVPGSRSNRPPGCLTAVELIGRIRSFRWRPDSLSSDARSGALNRVWVVMSTKSSRPRQAGGLHPRPGQGLLAPQCRRVGGDRTEARMRAFRRLWYMERHPELREFQKDLREEIVEKAESNLMIGLRAGPAVGDRARPRARQTRKRLIPGCCAIFFAADEPPALIVVQVTSPLRPRPPLGEWSPPFVARYINVVVNGAVDRADGDRRHSDRNRHPDDPPHNAASHRSPPSMWIVPA